MLLLFHSRTGGPFLVTDMHREESLFDIDPSARDRVKKGIGKDGSNLTVVSCACSWEEHDAQPTVEWDHVPNPQCTVPDHAVATDMAPVKVLESSHVIMSQEAGSLLGLALRYAHSFTWMFHTKLAFGLHMQ